MDIYEVLKTKPHNKHHLKRYVNFIKLCVEHNQKYDPKYVEKHHICPKSKDMFPEYENLKKNSWNECKLTYRQHIIAHIMLYRAFDTQSQLLAILYTMGQINAKASNVKSISIRSVEKIKTQLSEKRKGIFTRGYDADGNPLVKESTKILLSKQKKLFYQNEENRKKQSESCKGTTGRNSEKYSIAAKNRSPQHIEKISNSVKSYYNSLSKLERKRINGGIYVTPFGNFTYIGCTYKNYCVNNQKPFSVHNVKKNPYLNKSVIGKTPVDLGFNFIPKNDPTISQYYDGLNQVRQPEPNHLLSSELNDYLSQEIFRP